MTGQDRLSLACAGAALAAGIPLTALTRDRTYLMLAGLLVLLSFGVGVLIRHLGRSERYVALGQLAPVLLVPFLAGGDLRAMTAETITFVRTAVAPMPYDPGFAVFCAVLVWSVFVVTEALASGRGAGRTFVPLVVPYAIPAIVLPVETSMTLFGFVALGYVLVLAAATASDLEPGRRGGQRRGLATSAILITALALAGTVAVSVPIPERSALSKGSGGSQTTQIGDPSIDLIRNITSTSSAVVASYRTSDDAGVYLRLAALPMLDDSGFHPVAASLMPLQFPAGTPAGLGRQQVRTTITLGDLHSQYLPTPWLPLSANVAADKWRYDENTLAVVALGSGGADSDATANLSYETTSIRLPETAAILGAVTQADVASDDGLTLALPNDLSPEISTLTFDVVSRARGVGAKVTALLDFLHSDRFTYSTTVSPGTTMGTLEDFLLGSRTGYCEQFAGAMAVMSRILGIPSRVVVGFLPGRHVDGKWEVLARNMHAWTELYLGSDLGWVAVDPTPGSAVGTTPTSSASPSARPSGAEPTIAPSSQPSSVAPTIAPAPVTVDDDTSAPGWLPWTLAAAVVAGLVVAGPRLLRAGLRRFRLAGGTNPVRAAERAWAEVRATARDRGAPWPTGTTRQVSAALGAELDAEGRRALSDLALVVERARYDRRPADPAGLATLVSSIAAAIERRWPAPASGRWWPRSLRPRLTRLRRVRVASAR